MSPPEIERGRPQGPRTDGQWRQPRAKEAPPAPVPPFFSRVDDPGVRTLPRFDGHSAKRYRSCVRKPIGELVFRDLPYGNALDRRDGLGNR